MKEEEILAVAHRMAWRYNKSSDENHSDAYTFNEQCMIDFAKRIGKDGQQRVVKCDVLANHITPKCPWCGAPLHTSDNGECWNCEWPDIDDYI
jgi:hypothetical protein